MIQFKYYDNKELHLLIECGLSKFTSRFQYF
jgi:hypothetical protein